MAQTVNVNFRMDPSLKKSMESTCQELGMSMTTTFTIFAKKVTREKRIPFDVSVDPFYSDKNIRYLTEIASDVAAGRARLSEHELIDPDEWCGFAEILGRSVDEAKPFVYTAQRQEVTIIDCKGHHAGFSVLTTGVCRYTLL